MICLHNHTKILDLIFSCLTPRVKVCIYLEHFIFVSKCNDFSLLCTGRGSQWGYSHLEIRLGKSGCHLHSCVIGNLVLCHYLTQWEHIQAKQERCKN